MSLKSFLRRDDGSFKPAAIALIVVLAVLWGFVPVAIVTGFGIYDILANGPEAARVQADLEQEFRAISPLPGATSRGVRASHKPRTALVQDTYCTSLKYEEIRNYYDKELQVHGWTFYKEKKMTDWGRDFGGKEAKYCKGSYRATIEYAGDNITDSWNYAFSVSWGLSFDKDPEILSKLGCK